MKNVKIMYKLLLLCVAISISGIASAQEVIKGQVTDADTGSPINGVDVRFVGSTFETNTDESGMFSIEKTGTTNTLIFSHPDYEQHRFNTRDITGEISIVMTTNVRYNQYGQKVSRQPLTAESREGYIHFESEDRNYELWFDNRVFLDGAYYFDNYDKNKTADENLAEGRLDVPSQFLKARRARIAVKARVGDNWYAEIDFDFDGNVVDIKDIYARRYFGQPGQPWGQLRIGQFRMPQGMQQNTTSRYLKLMERASVAEFNTNRRLGIAWASWSQKYMYAIGVHTEEARNALDFVEGDPNYYKGALQGATPMLGVATRGAYYPINETGRLVSISAGFSTRTPGLYKFPDNRIKYDPKDETYVSEMEFTVAKVGGVKMATNMNIDAAVSFGSWRMTGEYYYNTLSMESGADAANFSGFYVQSAFLLTGETHAWNYREAEFTQVRADRKSGAWEVAARYSYINLNDFNAGVRGGQKGQYTVGVNYYASRNVKFMLNYSYVDHDQYSDGAGDYSDWIFEAAPGQPANPGFDYGIVAWRCEIDF